MNSGIKFGNALLITLAPVLVLRSLSIILWIKSSYSSYTLVKLFTLAMASWPVDSLLDNASNNSNKSSSGDKLRRLKFFLHVLLVT